MSPSIILTKLDLGGIITIDKESLPLFSEVFEH